MEARNKDLNQVQIDMKDLVFDYFNIITKEYEIAYEKWKADADYTEAVQKIKEEVDREFVAKKFEELPSGLTLEKAKAIISRKQEMINDLLMKSIQSRGANAQGELQIDQKELVLEISKFDDQLYIEEGFRKEEIERAIEVYQLDKRTEEQDTEAEEERRAMIQMMMERQNVSKGAPAVSAPNTTTSEP